MVDSVRTVAILGAGGSIGGLIGGLLAQNGMKVYFLSRTLEGAKTGLRKAMAQSRSHVISRYIECGDYDHLLEPALQDADLIIESVSENLQIKKKVYDLVERYRKPGTIVGTTTSSLPLSALADGRSNDYRRHFLATHFYNPPGKMLACEIACTEFTDSAVYNLMKDFLANRLRRLVIPVKNVPGYAGNRIAFTLFNRITSLAEQYGVEQIDYLIGPYTGRLMPPLATIDLVGLDIHKAIIENLSGALCNQTHESLVLPDYINRMITKAYCGNKTGGGFYKKLEGDKQLFIDPLTCDYIPQIEPHVVFVEKAKRLIHFGLYREAFETIKAGRGPEAEIVMEILCRYVAYSYSFIGEVTEPEYGIAAIDKVMTSGFNWAAPSAIVKMFGGIEATAEMLDRMGLDVPEAIRENGLTADVLNVGKYFIAR